MALVLRSTRRRSLTVSDLEYSVAQLRRDASQGLTTASYTHRGAKGRNEQATYLDMATKLSYHLIAALLCARPLCCAKATSISSAN